MPLSKFGQALADRVRCGFQAMSVVNADPGRLRAELVAFGEATKIPVISWSVAWGLQPIWPPPPSNDEPASAAWMRIQKILDKSSSEANEVLAEHAINPAFSGVIVVYHDAHTEFDVNSTLRSRFTTLFAGERFSGRPCLFTHPGSRIHPDVADLLDPLKLEPMTPNEINSGPLDFIRVSIAVGGGDPGVPIAKNDPLRLEIAAACGGLPSHKINDILSLSRNSTGPAFTAASPKRIRDYRASLINASGLLKVYGGGETFADVGGLDALKTFLTRILKPRDPGFPARPRGVMLHGVPGAGKSLIAKALGNETGRLTLELNIGSLMGGIVGETESNVRKALDIVDSAGAAILFLDEVEKALSGIQSGGKSDGGVVSRVFDSLLRWLNDHESDVFFIATANDVSALPPEFSRAERFDATFFVDTPMSAAKDVIWRMYLGKYGLNPEQPRPDDHWWTGAEIATACRQAALLGVPVTVAARSVVPIAKLNAKHLATSRDWAANHGAIDADLGVPYKKESRDELSVRTVKGTRKFTAGANDGSNN